MSKDLEKVEEKKNSTKSTKKNDTKKSSVKKTSSKEGASVKKSSGPKKATAKTSPKKSVNEKVNESITLEEADSFYHVSLLAQAVCVIGVLFISILAIFEHSFTVPIEVLIGITLLIMAYNNDKLFKRKGLTVVYLVFGIVCLLIGVLGYFGVTI
ncbi:MAG: hypothetical protein ACI31V_01570 [Bacilli bacterium]